MVLFRVDRRTLFTGDKRLEHPNGCAVNIASDESHPNTLVLGQGLKITDESVSFLLRGLELAITSTRNKVFEIPCDLLPSSDRS